ncbi:DUF1643 domain-containing protein [Plantibacter flavus]|uniref:DUF1643 domain-containing protein n=1 Tax=Plantibacter flavus TaxID=150123 RepID=UPI003F189D4E
MIAYPHGHEPDFWDPKPSQERHRFALGHVAGATHLKPPLIAMCMNPSHAREDQSDRTINRLIRASVENGYTGWIMLNLYPQRTPSPSALSKFDPALMATNEVAISRVISRFATSEILGAWGNLTHPTLLQARRGVLAMLAGLSVRIFTFDSLTKAGNPRHPNPRGLQLPMFGKKFYLDQAHPGPQSVGPAEA